MRRMLNNIALTGLLLITSCCWALNSDRNKPYQIDADSVVYNRPKHQTVYTGNVIAQQGSTTVSGDHITILSDPKTNKVVELIAQGQPAHYATLPDNHNNKLTASANTIKYWPKIGKVLLVKNGHIKQSHNEFSGALIWYDTVKQTVLSGSNKNSRTRIVIEPSATVRSDAS